LRTSKDQRRPGHSKSQSTNHAFNEDINDSPESEEKQYDSGPHSPEGGRYNPFLVSWKELGVRTFQNSMAGQACEVAIYSIKNFRIEPSTTDPGHSELLVRSMQSLRVWARRFATLKNEDGKQSLIYACLKIKGGN